ncbi:MAG: polysaccharide deacetylase [Rhizobiaceae bacterium]|nr:polysaccharide deacetylase [Rhizobiaceae bacterium]
MIANPVPWPNGAKCAACVTFDMDADSLVHIAHPKDSHRKVATTSMLQYGPEIAIPRIVETYRRLGIRQSFFIPAWCIERYPAAVETILEGGNEIGHHGYIHEHPNEISPEEEAHWLDTGIEIIKRATGKPPRGWRAPLYNMSDVSCTLLAERGFNYDASLMGDDVPYVLETSKGSLIELPTHWGLDDWPQFVQSEDLGYMGNIHPPSTGFEPYVQEFNAMKKYGGLWVAVVHPFATGRLARWEVVANFLEKEVAAGDVWFAPMEEIAEHVRKVTESGEYTPRRVSMPPYESGVYPQAVAQHRVTI